jgi:hypothetical protein
MDTRAVDESIHVLQDRKDAWAKLPIARKVEYLQGVMDRFFKVADKVVASSTQAKGMTSPDTMLGAEEWTHPYIITRILRLVRDTLKQIASAGRPVLPKGSVRTRSNGQVAVRVYPLNIPDKLLYRDFRGEVWMQPDVTPESLSDNMAAFYKRKDPDGKVALVLGAGNVASVGPSDLVQKLFVEGQVCFYKHNPVNEYLEPFYKEAFEELIRDGYLRIAYGASDLGEYLCLHSGVEEIHLTGSDRIYEVIVFGTGEEGKARKLKNQPRITKRVTCELGNVTPVIIVPGPWSESDIAFHCQNIATMMTNNCGFNCLSAKVLVLHTDWPLSGALMAGLRAVLEATPQRMAYYPGAEQRYEEVMSVNPTAQPIGQRSSGVLPYTLVPDLNPEDKDNPCFATECFMPLLAQTALPGADAAEFLRNAVRFCNENLWGTLSAHILIDPRTARSLGKEFLEQAIADLRYGTVSLNHWSAVSYVWGSPSWGAFPGHTPTDIQSGIGAVHNAFMFSKPEKSVLYGPFNTWPKPPWFITNKRNHRVFPKMVPLEMSPSLRKTVSIAFSAMGG